MLEVINVWLPADLPPLNFISLSASRSINIQCNYRCASARILS
jgi:hypothetical protein